MEKIFNKEKVDELAGNVLKEIIDKFKGEVIDKFYSELEGYLYEHYINVKERVEKDLIHTLADDFAKSPENYKYYKIRKRIYDENKDTILPRLTDEAIIKNVEKVLFDYSADEYYYSWQWKDAIVDIILNNFDRFINDQRAENKLLRKIQQLEDFSQSLLEQIKELEG